MKHWVDELAILELLMARIALDKPRATENLEQDILDLYLFPERLTDSYPDEWRSFIKRHVKQYASEEHKLNSIMSLLHHPEIENKIESIRMRFERYRKIISEAQAIVNSDAVATIETPLHRWLSKLVDPL